MPVAEQLPAVAEVVARRMCTVNVEAPWPCRLERCCPAGDVGGDRAEPAQPAPWEAIVQASPAVVGSVSDSVTPCASPVPVLKTVSVNPIGSPAFTCAASGVFTMWITGAATQVEAVDWSEPLFVVATLPVLLTTPSVLGQWPAVAFVVGDVMCTVNVEAPWVVPAGTLSVRR